MAVNNVSVEFEASASEAIMTTQNILLSNATRMYETMTAFEVTASALSVITILVNLCVINVLLIGPRAFRTPSFLFVGNFACGNVMNSVTILCIILSPPSSNLWKQIVNKGLFTACLSNAVITQAFMAVDRVLKIYHRGHYQKKLNNSRALVMIFASWFFSIGVFLFAPLFGWSCIKLCECSTNNPCNCILPYCASSFIPFTKAYLGLAVINFYLAISVILGLYLFLSSHICKCLGSRTKNGKVVVRQVPNYGPFVMVHRKRDIKLAKTLLLVTITFFICYVPVTMLFFFDICFVGKMGKWFKYFIIPVLAHTLICFIIYAYRLPRMWSTFKYFAFAIWRRLSCRTEQCRTLRGGNSKANRDFSEHPQPVNSGIKISSADSNQQSKQPSTELIEKNFEFNTKKNLETPKSGNEMLERITLDSERWSSEKNQESNSTSKNNLANSHSTHRKIRLASGTTVPRDRIAISPPYNTEIKMSWI